jgi:antitoxin component YwqK of YwqJK toxin-antitoxin module
MYSKKIIVLFIFISSFQLIRAQDTIWMDALQFDQENLTFHLPGADKAFNGYAYKISEDNPKTISRLHLVKGEVRFITSYYPSGEKSSTMKYGIRGPLGNVYFEYYPDGRKKLESKYHFSSRLKIWKYWNSKGQLCKITKYSKNGNLIETKEYNSGCEN